MSERTAAPDPGISHVARMTPIREWPLRRRLAVTMVTLMIVVVVIIGSVSVGTQRQSLLNRLDDQLRVSLEMSSRSLVDAQAQGILDNPAAGPDTAEAPASDVGVPGTGGPGPADVGPGPQLGSLLVVILDGETLVAQVIEESTGTVSQLTDAHIVELERSAGTAAEPVGIDLGDDVGTYRVAAEQISGPGHTATIIAGQSLTEVTQTVRDQVLVFSLVAVSTVSATLLVALFLIRLGLRPLDRLARVASRVTGTPLSSGAVRLSDRVPHADASPHTEVGQVGEAFNTMLDHVETSLQVRQDGEDRLRRFIADASHELRTPLTAISGYAELAEGSTDPLPHPVLRSLGRIRAESARMSVLVEDLLLLARLDSGTPLHEEPVALAGVVVDACTDAQVTGPHHRWLLELSDDAAEITVRGDAGRLHQVMTNLLTNARTHTPPGTTVTIRLSTADTSEAVIQVEDNGPGISEELRDRIFDRFVRGDDSRSRRAGSTGLGMSIVEAILKAHHGRIDLTSSQEGTLFTVTLPLHREAG